MLLYFLQQGRQGVPCMLRNEDLIIYRDLKQVGIAKMNVYTNLFPERYVPFRLAKDVNNLANFETPQKMAFYIQKD